MAMVRTITSALLVLLLSGCGNSTSETGKYRHETDQRVTSVAMTHHDGQLHVLWAERTSDNEARVYHRSTPDGGESWSDTSRVDEGMAAPDRVRRDNDLQLVAHEGRLLALWQTQGEGFMGAGPMVMAQSPDQGNSWEAMAPPATEADAEAHGFFAFSTDDNGRAHLAWLDNRTDQQGLHYAYMDEHEAGWSDTETLIEATCQCCWNSLAHDGQHHYLLYRALSPRDMTLLENDGQGWRQSGRVGAFDWEIDGCPHVGGDLAFSDGDLFALSWTGKEDQQGLYHLRDSGDGLSDPERLGSRHARHGSLATASEAPALAAWDEPGRGLIRISWLGVDAEPTQPRNLREAPDRQPIHPLTQLSPEEGHVLWTEKRKGGGSAWVLKTLPLP